MVERSILEHEHDDVIDFLEITGLGVRRIRHDRPSSMR
jgi:hypothetical protein